MATTVVDNTTPADGITVEEEGNLITQIGNIIFYGTPTGLPPKDPYDDSVISPNDFEGAATGRAPRTWGKIYFGNVWNTVRNYPYLTGIYWGRRQRMKKHRYRKRMQFQRFQVAAIAGLPISRKLRISMVPILKKSRVVGRNSARMQNTGDAKEIEQMTATAAMAAQRAMGEANVKGGGKLTRSRPKSKYAN